MIRTIAKKSYYVKVSYRTFTERMQLNIIVTEELEANSIKFPLDMAKTLHTVPTSSEMKPKIHALVRYGFSELEVFLLRCDFSKAYFIIMRESAEKKHPKIVKMIA